MELSDAVKGEIEAGRKVSAIKLLREETGMGLKEAKDIMDAYYSESGYGEISGPGLNHRHPVGSDHADTDAWRGSQRNDRIIATRPSSTARGFIKFVIVAALAYFLLKIFYE